jgi:hypothetical protein
MTESPEGYPLLPAGGQKIVAFANISFSEGDRMNNLLRDHN